MRNKLRWVGISILILVLLLLFIPNLFLRVRPAVASGTLQLSALLRPVTIHFDSYAVPHVYAENEHDLFYAAGYIMASERLFQMDMVNRSVQGRLAEMNKSLVAADRLLRTWGFHHIARRIVLDMDPETKRIIQWACDGINAYIDEHRANLPLEFKLAGHAPLRWDPSIAAGYARLMAYDLNQSWPWELVIGRLAELYDEAMIRDIFPGYPDTGLLILPAGTREYSSLLEPLLTAYDGVLQVLGRSDVASGSNSWVLSGQRTTTGKPMLANDPHLGFSQPAKWYELHLVGGRFNTQGVCLPGVPLPVVGHNQHIAWGFTNLMTDDMDFFDEQVNPEDEETYLYKGQWLPFTKREEVIAVKDAEPETLIVRETVHGVIISDLHPLAAQWDHPLAMRWTGQDISDEITALMKVNLSRDWDDFTAACRTFGVPGQIAVYADRQGNIGWRPLVWLPIRKGGGTLRVLPGASGEWDWQSMVPFNELPFSYNPPEGVIATANTRITGDNFPYYISAYWAPPARIERITEFLNSREHHSMSDMMALQNDVFSPHARELVPFLLAAYTQGGETHHSEHVSAALARLEDWDYVVDTESVEATIFNAWFLALIEAIYKDEMDRAGDRVYDSYLRVGGFLPLRNITRLLGQGHSPWFDNLNTPEVEGPYEIIRQSFEFAINNLGQDSGWRISGWKWGKRHTLTHRHALAGSGTIGKVLNWWLGLDVGPFPFPGSATTVNAAAYNLRAPYATTGGPSIRRVVNLADLDDTRMILPTGQSGNPFSRHYRDQAEMFLAGEYRKVPFSREAVERSDQTHSTLILSP